MRMVVAGCVVMFGCGEGPEAKYPIVSEECIADAAKYNRTISNDFRNGTAGPKDAPPPVEVEHELVEGKRIAGEKMILPTDATKQEIARHGVVETTASFRLCIGADGVPSEITRLSSTCFPRYDERIRTRMLEWRYSPYTVDGVPKEVCTTINFVYAQNSRRRR